MATFEISSYIQIKFYFLFFVMLSFKHSKRVKNKYSSSGICPYSNIQIEILIHVELSRLASVFVLLSQTNDNP